MDQVEPNANKGKQTLIFIIFFVIILVVSFLAWNRLFVSRDIDKLNSQKQEEKRSFEHANAYREALVGNNPKPIQELFLQDIKNGVNDKYTKSDAYFILHRFFDNGGNIYEIVDYINSHEELSFFKEAAKIYPVVFARIKRKELPTRGGDSSSYAVLAAFEVLEKKGYANVASNATAANQYAKLGYFAKLISTKHPTGIPGYIAKEIPLDIEKSLYFQKKSDDDIADILDNKNGIRESLEPRDILVALNQYAASLRALSALGIKYSSKKNPDEIFAFSTNYSKNVVPEFYLFTSLINATTLTYSKDDNGKRIEVAMYPVFNFDTKGKTIEKTSVIGRILFSREQKPIYFKGTTIEDEYYDIYGRRNIVTLAQKVPNFKKWLIDNGWQESDFK